MATAAQKAADIRKKALEKNYKAQQAAQKKILDQTIAANAATRTANTRSAQSELSAALARLANEYATQGQQAQQQYADNLKTTTQAIDNSAVSRGLARSTVPVTLGADNQTKLQTALAQDNTQRTNTFNTNKASANDAFQQALASINNTYAQADATARNQYQSDTANAQSTFNTQLAEILAQAALAAGSGGGGGGSRRIAASTEPGAGGGENVNKGSNYTQTPMDAANLMRSLASTPSYGASNPNKAAQASWKKKKQQQAKYNYMGAAHVPY